MTTLKTTMGEKGSKSLTENQNIGQIRQCRINIRRQEGEEPSPKEQVIKRTQEKLSSSSGSQEREGVTEEDGLTQGNDRGTRRCGQTQKKDYKMGQGNMLSKRLEIRSSRSISKTEKEQLRMSLPELLRTSENGGVLRLPVSRANFKEGIAVRSIGNTETVSTRKPSL